MHPPFLNAGNGGLFTLDGTRTYRVGVRQVVLIDPGPDVEDHVRALIDWVGGADEVRVLVTHAHRDHAGGARRLADALNAPVVGPDGVPMVDTPLPDGGEVETDEGILVAVDTPGHSAPHFCYHWRDRDALFVGDLLLGEGDTTWVGEYPGCVGDYLASLNRVRSLSPRVAYPAHGPAIDDVPATLKRYEAHRQERIERVARALQEQPGMTSDALLREVYGSELPSAVERAARSSIEALMEYVRERDRI